MVYAASLGNGLVWDDAAVIAQNPALRGDPAALFGAIDVTRAIEPTPYFRPLTLLSFALEERAHGLTPWAMHLGNVLLHAACAILVLALARSLIADRGAALGAALLCAVHPIHAEAVNFLSGGRNTLLACLFSLAAFLLHRRSARGGGAAGALLAALLFFAGLLSKEPALLVLPFIVSTEVARARAAPGSSWAGVLRRTAPFALAAVAYLVLRQRALAGAGVRLDALDVLDGLGDRLAQLAFVIPRALLSMVWPPAIAVHYPLPGNLRAIALPLAGAWLAIAAAAAWLLTRGRSAATLFGLAWAVAFWLPTSGVVPIPSGALADRYLYASAIGLWLVVADQGSRLVPEGHPWRRRAAFAVVAVLVLLAASAAVRTLDWRSDATLFAREVAAHPDDVFGHHNLGTWYLDQAGDLDAAEREFGKALAIDPGHWRLHTQLGYVRLQRGDLPGALRHYDAALEVDPADAEALLNRAMVLDVLGRQAEAARDYRRFLATPASELPRARPDAEARLRALAP
jgi:hypothetical protein